MGDYCLRCLQNQGYGGIQWVVTPMHAHEAIGGLLPARQPEAVRGQLQRILSSPQFARADRSRRFLEYVVEQVLEGRASELKETVIGAAVFNRPADYYPRNDSIVRMEAGRLRV